MQPNSAAQSNPAPLAGRQQAGSPLFRRDHVTHPADRGRGRRVVRGVLWYVRLFRPHPSLRATFPTRGKAFFGCAKSFTFYFSFYFSILLVNRRCIKRL